MENKNTNYITRIRQQFLNQNEFNLLQELSQKQIYKTLDYENLKGGFK